MKARGRHSLLHWTALYAVEYVVGAFVIHGMVPDKELGA